MTGPLEKPPETDVPTKDELVSANDRAVGQAFRWSAIVLVAIAVVGAIVVWWLRRPPAEKPAAAIEAASPVEVRAVGEAPKVTFTDVTREAGIDFVHFNGATGAKLLPETMGGGGAFFDLDRDGDSDLLLVNSTSWPGDPKPPHAPTVSLYRNLGGGRFQNVTADGRAARLDFYGQGVAVGDYDGDGWTDAFITAVGSNHLLRNDEGRLVDATAQAKVAGEPDAWSTRRRLLRRRPATATSTSSSATTSSGRPTSIAR